MSTQPTCPSCRHDQFHDVDGGRMARCSRCSWLVKRTASGGVETAFNPYAGPQKAKRVKRTPFDMAKLDRLFREGPR